MKDLREIDALVEVEIFGTEVIRVEDGVNNKAEYDLWLEPGWVEFISWLPDFEDFLPIERRSSDIAAAWKVVEKLKDNRQTEGEDVREFGPEIIYDIDTQEWIVILVGPGGRVGTAKENAIEYAICLAALRACGVEAE